MCQVTTYTRGMQIRTEGELDQRIDKTLWFPALHYGPNIDNEGEELIRCAALSETSSSNFHLQLALFYKTHALKSSHLVLKTTL